jgi:hypothetical protein
MRKSLVLAALLVFALGTGAFAGIPDPAYSGVGNNAGSTTCHHKLTNDDTPGSPGDTLIVYVTVRDAFSLPVSGCTTTAHIAYDDTIPGFGPTGFAYSDCCGEVAMDTTDAAGRVELYFEHIQGRGHVKYTVTARCQGIWGLGGNDQIQYTTPNLRGELNGITDVFDLGVWAGGLPPNYDIYADYTCDGTVDVFDLGYWASGLVWNCATVACP